MPVSNTTVSTFLQLGVAGATLLILLVIILLLFKFMNRVNTTDNSSQMNRVDKLCDKIDALITSFAANTQELNKVLLSNDKDQKETLAMLDKILANLLDVQVRVVRIDDRTYACIGLEPKSKKEKEVV